MKMKKWMLATAMATAMMGMTATEAMAEMVTYYCVPYADATIDGSSVSISTIISQNVDSAEAVDKACGAGTSIAWDDYIAANYKGSVNTGILGPYDSRNDANHEYLKIKEFASSRGANFHHASDFSYQPD